MKEKCLICNCEETLFSDNGETFCLDCDNEEFKKKCDGCLAPNKLKYITVGKQKYCFECSQELFF